MNILRRVISVYNYPEAISFLQDVLKEKKNKNPSFSIRTWAKKLGLGSHAAISAMLAGKRPIPKKYVKTISQSLELGLQESIYLEALVDYTNCRDLEHRSYYERHLQALAPQKRVSMTELETFRLRGDPIHMAILEMTDLKEFQPRASWIRDRFRFSTSQEEVEEAIQRLFNLGLLKQEGGTWKKTHQSITTKPDVLNRGVQEYHKRISVMASRIIEHEPLQRREFNAYALNICPSQMNEAKRLIREFSQEFIKQIEALPREGADTYHLNVQFFPMTRGLSH